MRMVEKAIPKTIAIPKVSQKASVRLIGRIPSTVVTEVMMIG